MKKVRKLIAAVAAMAMVLTSFVQVSAMLNFAGIHYKDGFYDFTAGSKIAAGTYTYQNLKSDVNFKVSYGADAAICKVKGNQASSGTRSLYVYGGGSGDTTPGARVIFETAQKVSSKTYKVSFNYANESYSWLHRVMYNNQGQNAAGSRVNEAGTYWNKTTLGQGQDIGGIGDFTWYHCEKTFTSDYAATIDIAAFGWADFCIDDLLITDENDNVIFFEDFEQTEPSSTRLTRWQLQGDSSELTYDLLSQLNFTPSTTNHVLHLHGNNTGGVARLWINVPIVEDNLYTLTYDKIAVGGQIITAVSVGMTDSVYPSDGTGYQITSSAGSSGELTINSRGNTTLRINVEGWGLVRLDNICLKDKYGNVVFFEDFEEHDREFSPPQVRIGGASRYKINATGTANVTASVENNNEDSPFNCYLIAAVYDSTGTELEGFVYDNATLSKNTRKDFDLSVPVTNGQKLHLFWWDNITGDIKPVENYDGTPIKSKKY